MDPLSLVISALALLFSVAAFFWQHLRKSDSIVCTLMANEVKDRIGYFQFSIANIGSRSALLRDISVAIFLRKEHHGIFKDDSTASDLPKVVRPGEIVPVRVETRWNDVFLENAVREALDVDINLFFVAKVVLWNPEGTRLTGSREVAVLTIARDGKSSSYTAACDRTFRCMRSRK